MTQWQRNWIMETKTSTQNKVSHGGGGQRDVRSVRAMFAHHSLRHSSISHERWSVASIKFIFRKLNRETWTTTASCKWTKLARKWCTCENWRIKESYLCGEAPVKDLIYDTHTQNPVRNVCAYARRLQPELELEVEVNLLFGSCDKRTRLSAKKYNFQ